MKIVDSTKNLCGGVTAQGPITWQHSTPHRHTLVSACPSSCRFIRIARLGPGTNASDLRPRLRALLTGCNHTFSAAAVGHSANIEPRADWGHLMRVGGSLPGCPADERAAKGVLCTWHNAPTPVYGSAAVCR